MAQFPFGNDPAKIEKYLAFWKSRKFPALKSTTMPSARRSQIWCRISNKFRPPGVRC